MAKKKIKRKQQYVKPKERTLKEWWRDQNARTQKAIICAVIAVAAVILLGCVYYYGIYDDGSLRVSRDAIVGAQQNWLIGEGNKGKNSKYYHVANVETPAGMTLKEESLTTGSTSLRTDFSFGTDQEEISLYLCAVNDSVNGIVESVHERFASMVAQTGEITDIVTEADGSRYFCYQYSFDDDEGTHYAQSVVYYMPSAVASRCVLISASVSTDTADNYRTVEELLPYVLEAKAGVTLVEK